MNIDSVLTVVTAVFAVIGAVGTVLSAVGAALPAESQLGQWCSRIGSDLRWVVENARK